jgi:hypothetical protein
VNQRLAGDDGNRMRRQHRGGEQQAKQADAAQRDFQRLKTWWATLLAIENGEPHLFEFHPQ